MLARIYLTIVLSVIPTHISGTPLDRVSDSENKKSQRTSIVEIKNLHRKKRSIDSDNGHSGYDLELFAFDKSHKLKLRSASDKDQIFSDGFQFHHVDVDENGDFMKIERTPSKREIQQVEQNIFFDHGANAILSVREVDGGVQLEGIVDKMRIRRNENNEHLATEDEKGKESSQLTSDYVDVKRPIATPRGISTGVVSVTSEILLTFDHENAEFFNFDNKKIMEYLAMFMSGVNFRFGTVDDPKIKFVISGIIAINSTEGQPFISCCFTNITGTKTEPPGPYYGFGQRPKIHVPKVLSAYKDWINSHSDELPKHDQSALLFAVDPEIADGMAYGDCACASCRHVCMNEGGGLWDGVKGTAHELGHNLGCLDENEPGTPEECKPDPNGKYTHYIMGGGGTSRYDEITFSPCCIQLMKHFVQSTGASCLFKQDNPSPPPQTLPIFMDPLERCKNVTGHLNVTFDDSMHPDDQCSKPMCRFQFGQLGNKVHNFRLGPADENSTCGGNGKCNKNGRCVWTKERTEMMGMKEFCQKRTGHDNAYPYVADFNEQCLKLECVWWTSGAHVSSHGPAEDGIQCGQTGHCYNGTCGYSEKYPPPPPTRDWTEECRKWTGNSNATFDDSLRPDDQCTKPVCMYRIDDYDSKRILLQARVDNSVCGTTGSCQNGTCVWTKENPRPPRMSMEELCKKRSGQEKATVYGENPDDRCLKLRCAKWSPEGLFRLTSYGPAEDGTPCSKTKHCIGGKCGYSEEYPPPPPTRNWITECPKETGIPQAVFDNSQWPDNQCNKPICRYRIGNERKSVTLEARVDGSTCGKTGTCQNGTCVFTKDKPRPKLMNMDMICRKRTGYDDAAPRSADSNEQCLKLECGHWEDGRGYSSFHGPAEDGTPCGPKMTCQKGVCIKQH